MSKNAWPLPPPPKPDKTAPPQESTAALAASKLSAVKTYRKAMGLCYKCGLKWSKDHKCAPKVLHAIHDIWESLSADECSVPSDSIEHHEQVFMALSKSAVNGTSAPRTIQLTG